jgi:hypothetical protein
MVRRIARVLIGALLFLPVVTAALAVDDNATKPAPQPSPAPQTSQTMGSFPPAPPMGGAPAATRSLRRPAPAGPGGDGGRPDDTVGGLPGAKPSIPDKQP